MDFPITIHTREELQEIGKVIAGELRSLLNISPPIHPVPYDPVHQVQQQALQLVREGRRAESIELLKSYSKRERSGRGK